MYDKPVLFSDFDGVINFINSIENYALIHDAFTQLKKERITDIRNNKWDVRWSQELVDALMELKRTTGYTWVWLTTWTGSTQFLDARLGITSDRDLLWDPFNYNHSYPVQTEYRDARKLELLLEEVEQNPRPFVWVDDTAAQLWTEEHSEKMTVPHLIVKPNPFTGISRLELNQIEHFMETYS